MAEKSQPYQEDDWEFLPPNSPFLEFGLGDIKDLISTEIDYMDYLREENLLKLIRDQEENQRKQPELTESPNYASDKKKTSDAEDEESEQEVEERNSVNDEKKERPPCKRGLAAGIGLLCSVVAAACVVMIGGGKQRRSETRRYAAASAAACVVKRLKQRMVATARAPPQPVMRTATISFGGCFDGL